MSWSQVWISYRWGMTLTPLKGEKVNLFNFSAFKYCIDRPLTSPFSSFSTFSSFASLNTEIFRILLRGVLTSKGLNGPRMDGLTWRGLLSLELIMLERRRWEACGVLVFLSSSFIWSNAMLFPVSCDDVRWGACVWLGACGDVCDEVMCLM